METPLNRSACSRLRSTTSIGWEGSTWRAGSFSGGCAGALFGSFMTSIIVLSRFVVPWPDSFRTLKLRKDKECPVCGEHPTIKEYIDYEGFCAAPVSPR